ncbi:MAG: type IV pilus assembly protein FimV, partial [Gammaproteobacteria bacterium]
MTDHKNTGILERDIARALDSRAGTSPKNLLIAGLAIACIQPESAMALGLGELQVKSGLGQPLVSTTTARIGSNESLSDGCLTAVSNPNPGMAVPKDLKISVPTTSEPGSHSIQITTRTPLYEPMYEIRIKMKCGTGVTLVRDYVVMLNLPMTSPQTQPLAQTSTQPALTLPLKAKPVMPEATRTEGNAPTTRDAAQTVVTSGTTANGSTDLTPYSERYPTPDAAIEAGGEYQVQQGDMLSSIAQRVSGRATGATFAVADQLFLLNPDAFIANDPNKIKLGAVLRIPAADELATDRRKLLADNTTAKADTNSLVDKSIANGPVAPEELDVTPEAIATDIEEERANESIVDNVNEPVELPQENLSDALAEEPLANTEQPVAVEQQPTEVSEPEILVDISEPLEPVFEIEANELETAATKALTPIDTAVETSAEALNEENTSSSWLTTLLAALAAIILGLFAGLFLRARNTGVSISMAASQLLNKNSDSQPGQSSAVENFLAEKQDASIKLGDQSLGDVSDEHEADVAAPEDISEAAKPVKP